MSEASKHKIFIKAVYPETLVNTSSRRWMLRRASLYERFQSAASHFICVFETVLNFWRPLLSSSTNTSHPLRGSLSSFGANPATSAFLQALFNWFHLTQTSDGVSFTELRDTGPPFLALPLRGPPAVSVQEFVCGISLVRVSRVTSSPPRFESDPRWQLLGECRDVSIRLSKEIAPGSSRSLRANQTLHAAPTDALSPAPNCRGVKGGWERRRGAGWDAEHSNQSEQTPWAGVSGSSVWLRLFLQKRPLGYLPHSLNYWGRAGERTTSEEVSSFCSVLHFFERNFSRLALIKLSVHRGEGQNLVL